MNFFILNKDLPVNILILNIKFFINDKLNTKQIILILKDIYKCEFKYGIL